MDRILKSKYKIQDKIADSPSHVTYKGALVDSEKNIVIKIYRRQYLDSVLIKQLKKEIGILKKLDNPLIPRLIDGDYGWQGFYFVREFVEGQSLREIKLPMDPENARDTAIGICDVVAAAHGAGMVHGSITPENVFFSSPDKRVKVADFGIKMAVAEPVEQRAKWLLDGSSAYSPPEILLGESSSQRSDIYQIGLLILLMLSPEQIGTKSSLSSIVANLTGKDPQFGSKVPKYLEDIVRVCIQKDPLMRFSSVKELAGCLRSRSVPDKRAGFMDILEDNYSVIEEPDNRKEETEEPHKEEKTPGIGIFSEDTSCEKSDRMNLVKWVVFSVWAAIAAGIIYSLLNILLLGE